MPQAELPGRRRLSEPRLHRRREGVFLVLAGMTLVACALLPILGTGKLFGASRIVRELGVPLSMTLLLPVGAVALPLGLLAIGLICELYGRSRARALVFVGFVLWLGLLGLAWVTDTVPDFDGGTTRVFGPAVALVGCCTVTLVLHVELFHAIGRGTRGRHLWLRNTLSAVIALAAGWGTFALIVSYVPRAALAPLAGFEPVAQLTAITLAAAGYAALAAIVGTIPFYVVAKALAIYVRVERFSDVARPRERKVQRRDVPAFVGKPAAQLVDEPAASRSGPSTSRPFTRDEVAFFDEGEELANKPAADSFSDLNRPDRER
jgi:hypothetical protein